MRDRDPDRLLMDIRVYRREREALKPATHPDAVRQRLALLEKERKAARELVELLDSGMYLPAAWVRDKEGTS